jgi:N-acetylneuraminic acid mutarotase
VIGGWFSLHGVSRNMSPLQKKLHRVRQLAWLSLFAVMCLARGQSGGFTYEGRLTDNGAPANGLYDFRFTLHDALIGGTDVSAPVSIAPQAVSNGIFIVSLNFGPTAFNGAPRWLQIGVRTNNAIAAHFIFTPRQGINATPYALYAMTPAGPQGPKGDPGLPGTTSASDITSGTLADARLSANVALKNTDLVTVSNGLSARLLATNAALVAENSAMRDQLITLSNTLKEAAPAGLVVASRDVADPNLIAKNYKLVFSAPEPLWQDGDAAGQPAARERHSMTWTGSEALVWGGAIGAGSFSGTGARYDAAADDWLSLSSFGAPAPRAAHSAVWTGDQLLVWGGFASAGALNSGGRFSPARQEWKAIANANAPAPRGDHVAAWTGSRMVVWGGRSLGQFFNSGGIYNPSIDQWNSLLPSPLTARYGATAIWTGSRLVVWGGTDATGVTASGAALPIDATGAAQPWQLMNATAGPSPRAGHVAVWTGQRMLVWGGKNSSTTLDDGAAFDPVANSWTPLSSDGGPSPRSGHVAVWTREEMVIFGGEDASSRALSTAAAYNPTLDKWRTLKSAASGGARSGAAAAFTGSDLVVFGGRNGGELVAGLQRINTQLPWRFFLKP